MKKRAVKYTPAAMLVQVLYKAMCSFPKCFACFLLTFTMLAILKCAAGGMRPGIESGMEQNEVWEQ